MTDKTNRAEKELLRILLEDAVTCFYKNDKQLIELGGMEQACVARIYYYMQEMIKSDARFQVFLCLHLDCEYNKKKGRPKLIPDSKHGKRPDIILHRRNEKEQNKLVVEFKTHNGENETNDIAKLRAFTCPGGDYAYSLGAFVRLNVQEAKYIYFKQGEEIACSAGNNF